MTKNKVTTQYPENRDSDLTPQPTSQIRIENDTSLTVCHIPRLQSKNPASQPRVSFGLAGVHYSRRVPNIRHASRWASASADTRGPLVELTREAVRLAAPESRLASRQATQSPHCLSTRRTSRQPRRGCASTAPLPTTWSKTTGLPRGSGPLRTTTRRLARSGKATRRRGTSRRAPP